MLFHLQMRWNLTPRLTFDQVWEVEIEEGVRRENEVQNPPDVQGGGPTKSNSHMDMASADELDRAISRHLPVREFLEFEAIWPLRDFKDFLADCKTLQGSQHASIADRP
jgi:muconolactone D-isomerase